MTGVTDKGGGRGRVERLDYWLWHQDIVTAAPTIDVKVFSIEGEGLFIALASFNSSEASKQQSTIFKWHHDHFRLHQSIYTIAARGWETFRIGTDVSGALTLKNFDYLERALRFSLFKDTKLARYYTV